MIHRLAITLAACVAAATGAGPATPLPAAVDDALPVYAPAQNFVGAAIASSGSSTVTNLLNRWSGAYQEFQPGVKFTISGAGSGTAPPALTSGAAQLAPMSRPMNDAERAAFRARFGYDPTELVVAIDALAVFVNADNPIESLSLEEVDALFSRDLRRGHEPVSAWGDLGVAGDLADQPIIVYGFRDTAGGYSLFRDLVLKGGDYRSDISVQPGSSAIVNGVGAYDNAVGYASQFFLTRRTRMVPIRDENGVAHAPDLASCENGKYPLARELYIYINKAPDKPLDPLVADFLRFVLSKQGQTIAAEDGNFPISAALAAEQLAKIED